MMLHQLSGLVVKPVNVSKRTALADALRAALAAKVAAETGECSTPRTGGEGGA